MDVARERRTRLEDLEAEFEESVSALQMAENSRNNKTPLALSADSLGLGGGVSARSLGLAAGGGLSGGNPSSLTMADLAGSSFPAQLRSSFSSGGMGMLDALRREGMSASALGYSPSALGFQGSDNNSRLSDLSLTGMAGASVFANSALHQGLLEGADSQSKMSAAAAASMNMNNMNMNLDAATLRDMVRMSDRGQSVSNLTADRRNLQERILAMQLAKGYEQGGVRENTALGLHTGVPNLSRYGSGAMPSSAGSIGDSSASLGFTGLARSASRQLAGLSSASSTASSLSQYALSQDLLQQQILQQRQQLQWAEEDANRRRISEIMTNMGNAGAGANGVNAGIDLTGESTQAASAQRLHGLTDTMGPEPKRPRFN